MPEFTTSWRNRLRNAQRELLDDIGVAKAMELTKMSKSVVYRWQSEADDLLMSIPHALILEGYARRPLVSRVMAEFNDRTLSSPDERAERIACLSGQVAELVTQVSTMMARTAQAGSDGFYSVAEVNELLKLNGAVRRVADDLDGVLATVKASGGLSVVNGRGS